MDRIKQLFFGSKQEKLTEKAFMQSITASILSILLCIVALCSVTWAWFNEDVTSSANTIKAGNCNVAVSVMNGETEIAPEADTTGTYAFEAGKSYQINIASTGTGDSSYCKLVINGQDCYTEQMSTAESKNAITFTLTFDAPTEVEIITRWGRYHASDDQKILYNGKSYINLTERAG